MRTGGDDGAGKIERELRAPSEPVALIGALVALDLRMERIGIEACSLSFWLHQGMTRAGLPVLCIETRAVMNTISIGPRHEGRGTRRVLELA